jgi:hypothetical protein
MTIERNPEFDTFLLIGYDILRGTNPQTKERYPLMHVVWSGFNLAARQIFTEMDIVAYTKALGETGLIQLSPTKGGAMLRPLAALLTEATPEQQALAVRYRAFLTDFKKKFESDREQRRTKKQPKACDGTCTAQPSRKVRAAAKLLESGNTAAALKKLGY